MPVTRPVLLVGAALLVAALWLLPWRELGLSPFTAHMLRHMGLVAVAAPLVAAALGAGAWAISPLLATVLEFAVVWGWHLPRLHEAAATNGLAFAAEQFSYLGVGVLLWNATLQGANRLAGAGGMLLTSMHMTLLGALLVLANRPLYSAICFGADPLADQQAGGMLMLAIGTPIYLAAGLWLVYRELEGGETPGREGA